MLAVLLAACALWLSGRTPARAETRLILSDAATLPVPEEGLVLLEAPHERTPLAARALAGAEALPDLSTLSGRKVFWTRLSLVRTPDAPARWLLTPDRGWRKVEVYDASGKLLMTNGSEVPLAERPFVAGRALFPLELTGGEHTYLLRFEGVLDGWEPPYQFLLALEPEADALLELRRRHLALGLYAGLLLAIALVNVLFASILRDRIYVDYLAYAIPYALIWCCAEFACAELFWPDTPNVDNAVLFVAICAAIVFGNRFSARFLSLSREAPRLGHLLRAIDVMVGFAVLLALFGKWRVVSDLLGGAALAACGVYLCAGVVTTLHGLRIGRFFLAATGVMALGTIIYTLRYFGILPDWPLTEASAQIGSAVEMVLLAFALGDRVRLAEARRRSAEENLRRGLEREVEQRTAELASANSELIEVNQRLELLSLTDPLTGLANRRRFQSALEQSFRAVEQGGATLSVMLVDVDQFKNYNDAYGHQAGDECLQSVARALSRGTRKQSDVVARYGGEEFVLLLPGMSESAALDHAERLRRAILELELVHAHSTVAPFVTVSIGVASRAGDLSTRDAEALIAEADRALYRAKHEGRNRVARISLPPPRDDEKDADASKAHAFASGSYPRKSMPPGAGEGAALDEPRDTGSLPPGTLSK